MDINEMSVSIVPACCDVDGDGKGGTAEHISYITHLLFLV